MVAGGSLRAMEAILRGDVEHAFHPGGGLHHAMRDRASGFCIYNDVALAVARARRDGLRVLYLDLDVHHGDGVQALFRDDPGVLTVSFHETGRYLFPGTGFADEIGEGVAAGTSVNVPLEPGTGEGPWLDAVRLLVPSLAAAFRPDIVVSQHGADSHAFDPLAHLRVTTTAMGAAARIVDAVAHRWAGGRWLATGGGGYDAYRVVPRSWSLVWLAGAHRDVPVCDARGVAGAVGRGGGTVRAGATPRDVRRSPECRPPLRAGPGRCRGAVQRDDARSSPPPSFRRSCGRRSGVAGGTRSLLQGTRPSRRSREARQPCMHASRHRTSRGSRSRIAFFRCIRGSMLATADERDRVSVTAAIVQDVLVGAVVSAAAESGARPRDPGDRRRAGASGARAWRRRCSRRTSPRSAPVMSRSPRRSPSPSAIRSNRSTTRSGHRSPAASSKAPASRSAPPPAASVASTRSPSRRPSAERRLHRPNVTPRGGRSRTRTASPVTSAQSRPLPGHGPVPVSAAKASFSRRGIRRSKRGFEAPCQLASRPRRPNDQQLPDRRAVREPPEVRRRQRLGLHSRPAELLLETPHLRMDLGCDDLGRLRIVQHDVDPPAGRLVDRDLRHSPPARVRDAQQLLDHPRLDVIAHDRPGVRIEPDRQVRPERLSQRDERRKALVRGPSSISLRWLRLIPDASADALRLESGIKAEVDAISPHERCGSAGGRCAAADRALAARKYAMGRSEAGAAHRAITSSVAAGVSTPIDSISPRTLQWPRQISRSGRRRRRSGQFGRPGCHSTSLQSTTADWIAPDPLGECRCHRQSRVRRRGRTKARAGRLLTRDGVLADETVACEATTDVAGLEHLVDLEEGTYTGRSHGHARPHGSARAVQPGRPRLVRHDLRGPHPGPGRGLGGDRARRAHADPRADGQRQDPRRVPVRPRPPRSRPQPARHAREPRPRPRPVHQPAQGAHLRRRAQPPRAARRDRARGRPPRRARATHHGRLTDRRHAPGGAPRDRPAPAGHPHHDARIALPDAHQSAPATRSGTSSTSSSTRSTRSPAPSAAPTSR